MNGRRTFVTILLGLLILLLTSSGVIGAVDSRIVLTDREKEFIAAHKEVLLGIDPSFIPYEFIDADGAYNGIAADYCRLISEKTGLKLSAQTGLTWVEAHRLAINGQLDVLPCVSKTVERQEHFLFSAPYINFQRVIFVRKNGTQINSFDDLQGKQVAVQSDSSHHGYLKTIPGIKLSLYNTVEQALQALADGRETAFVGNLVTTGYLMKIRGISNLAYIEIAGQAEEALYFAVRKDWPELVSIINKALSGVTEQERMGIVNRWAGMAERLAYEQRLQTLAIIGAIFTVAMLFSGYWIFLLKREIGLHKRTQDALRLVKEEAEAANRVKSSFLARMSHEIRTPLNAILGMAYLLGRTEVSPGQKLYVNNITQVSKSMLGIINDILDFSKVEAGKVEIERIPFNLDLVLQQIVNIVAYKIEEQGIEFSLSKDPLLPSGFLGDPTRVQQVLLNIVNNAIKFTTAGSVAISVSLLARQGSACSIEFKVTDTGVGMSAEQMGQIFEPFDQGDSSIGRRFGGTGLGLPIAKTLVELMGGDIQVSSVPDHGSTFIIHLTLMEDTSLVSEGKLQESSAKFEHLRVLVAEKSAFYSNLLKGYLESFHIAAEYLSSGEQAEVELARADDEGQPYDLLILDYATPEPDGIEFFKQVRATRKRPPKCILMIPIAKEFLFGRFEQEHINHGVIKPFLPSTIYNAIIETQKERIMREHQRPIQANSSTQLMEGESFRVLIVEDNKTNQLIAQSILDQAGFRIVLASDGQAGYEAFVANRADLDLILMDIHMPVLDGFASTRLIRELDHDIPIIAMTADAIAGIENKCRSCGMNHYVSKPFEPEQFIGTILQVLRSRGTENAATPAEQLEGGPVEQKQHEQQSAIDQPDGVMRLGGNNELYLRILAQYYRENLSVPATLEAAIAQQDFATAVQIVHKLKSSSGNIGAKRLYQVASELQNALQSDPPANVTDHYQSFLAELNQVLQEISLIAYPLEN